MLKKNFLIIILVVFLLAAGVAADIFFWKHIAADNQHQQEQWQTKIDTLSAQITQQQNDLQALQTKLTLLLRSQQQGNTQQTLNEIAYLLDLANLYLQINHDTNNAIKSLQLAQHHLQQLADPSLLPLQQALAGDLNRLNDTPAIDVADVLLRLQTLSDSISRLTPQTESLAPAINTPENSTNTSLSWYKKSLQDAWSSFKNLLVIRYQSSANKSILPPNQHEWLRENIAFTLAQAQWAVLQQKSALYQQSLTSVRQWLTDYYPDNPERSKILARITELLAINIAPNLPDIHASLQAVQQVLKNLPTYSTSPAVNLPAKPETPTPPLTPPSQPEKINPPPAGIEI